MTKEETVKIMAMLGAFYAGGKNDPKMQATAWYLVLSKYDYRIASKAIIHFAENDTREYASFPPVGRIVAEIKKEMAAEQKPISETLHGVSYGRDYAQLSEDARKIIDKDTYESWLKIDAMEFSSEYERYAAILTNSQMCLVENVYEQD